MLQLLELEKNLNILDIGSGSGWTTALLAHITGSKGTVKGLERIPELTTFGQKNLAQYALSHAHIQHVSTENSLGIVEDKFDRILVSAAAKKLPIELIKQLKDPGILVIPVQNHIEKIKINQGKLSREKIQGFRFVPLIY